MKDKLTEMNREELVSYIDRWKKKQTKFQQGSKNWLKCNTRINRANLNLRTISN